MKTTVIPTNEQLVSRRWASARWQVSIETLKRREKAGILTPLKLGRSTRYRLSQIEALEREAEVR